jgi:hypothetical protein
MKNFEEKAIKDLSKVVGGEEGDTTIRLTGDIGKDEWNCTQIKVDIEITKKVF